MVQVWRFLAEKVPLRQGMHMMMEERPVAVAKVPGGHRTQRPFPRPAAYWPAGQELQRGAPERLNEPGAHSRQADGLEAPGAGLKVPERHSRHEGERRLGWKVPGAQGAHWKAPGGANRPAGHGRQASTEVAPGEARKVPAGQRRQPRGVR